MPQGSGQTKCVTVEGVIEVDGKYTLSEKMEEERASAWQNKRRK